MRSAITRRVVDVDVGMFLPRVLGLKACDRLLQRRWRLHPRLRLVNERHEDDACATSHVRRPVQ